VTSRGTQQGWLPDKSSCTSDRRPESWQDTYVEHSPVETPDGDWVDANGVHDQDGRLETHELDPGQIRTSVRTDAWLADRSIDGRGQATTLSARAGPLGQLAALVTMSGRHRG